MALGLLVKAFLCVMNNGDKPIPILPEGENNLTVDIVAIHDHTPNFGEILPPYRFKRSPPRQ